MAQCSVAEIIAVSERSYDAAPGHDVHDFWQLVLPLVGALDMRIDGCAGVVDRVRYAALPPGTDHVYRAHGVNRFLVVDLVLPASGRALPALREMGGRMASIVGVLRAEAEAGGLRAPGIRSALGLYVGAALEAEAAAAAPEQAGSSNSSSIATRARAMIESEPGRAWTIEELAYAACASPRHLNRCFVATYGVPPARFARSVRLAEAKRLLSSGSISAGEAAVRTGFASQSHFTSAFFAEFGLTPGASKRQHVSDSGNTVSEFHKPVRARACSNGEHQSRESERA